MSTVRDTATLNELRRLILRLERLEAQISQFVKNNTVITNHDTLQNLDYASSGHTGFASSGAITAHTGDATIHFTEGSIDHTAITNIGTNTHAQIDTHIARAPSASGYFMVGLDGGSATDALEADFGLDGGGA